MLSKIWFFAQVVILTNPILAWIQAGFIDTIKQLKSCFLVIALIYAKSSNIIYRF